MILNIQDLITAFSGIGIFLFGIQIMENSLITSMGHNLKKILINSTNTVKKSILTGFLSTLVLQNSTTVTIIALGFVGLGIINLISGIGIIFGTNLGTAIVSAFLILLGFKTKIDLLALPMIALGGFLQIIFKSKRIKSICNIFVGFGLLFLGLEYLKNSLENILINFDIIKYSDFGIFFFIICGIIITFLIQSSTASILVLVSLLDKIDLKNALGAIIGINIGATIVTFLVSITGNSDKKRLALAHIIFNLLTGLVVFIFFDFFQYFILDFFNLKGDPVFAIIIFHIFFNIFGIFLLVKFIPDIANLLKKFFKTKKKYYTLYIQNISTEIPEIAINAIYQESLNLIKKSIIFCTELINIQNSFLKQRKSYLNEILNFNNDVIYSNLEKYQKIKKIELEIINYIAKLETSQLTKIQQLKLNKILQINKEIVLSVKQVKDIKQNLDEFTEDNKNFIHIKYNQFRRRLFSIYYPIFQFMFIDNNLKNKKECKNFLFILKEINSKIIKDDKKEINFITKHILENDFKGIDVPTLINVNRAVYLSSSGILTSLIYFLEEYVIIYNF